MLYNIPSIFQEPRLAFHVAFKRTTRITYQALGNHPDNRNVLAKIKIKKQIYCSPQSSNGI